MFEKGKYSEKSIHWVEKHKCPIANDTMYGMIGHTLDYTYIQRFPLSDIEFTRWW